MLTKKSQKLRLQVHDETSLHIYFNLSQQRLVNTLQYTDFTVSYML